ncbi:putative non-classical export protein [Septoria linicola]|nr:putative non-classical export protein [Septoria linicola]
MSTPYLISKAIDPIFAVSVGFAAAAVRINREEKEKGHTTQQTIDALKRRTGLIFGGAVEKIEEKTG